MRFNNTIDRFIGIIDDIIREVNSSKISLSALRSRLYHTRHWYPENVPNFVDSSLQVLQDNKDAYIKILLLIDQLSDLRRRTPWDLVSEDQLDKLHNQAYSRYQLIGTDGDDTGSYIIDDVRDLHDDQSAAGMIDLKKIISDVGRKATPKDNSLMVSLERVRNHIRNYNY